MLGERILEKEEAERKLKHIRYLGYETASVDDAIKKDMATGLIRLKKFEEKINEIEEIRNKLGSSDVKKLDHLSGLAEGLMKDSGGFPEIERAISGLWSEIEIEKEKKKQIAMDGKRVCPRCTAILPGKSQMCSKCGKALDIVEEPIVFACPVCSATVLENDSRCLKCGALFSEIEEPDIRPDITVKQCKSCTTHLGEQNKERQCLSCGRLFCDACPGRHIPPENNKLEMMIRYDLVLNTGEIRNEQVNVFTEMLPFRLCPTCYQISMENVKRKLEQKKADWMKETEKVGRINLSNP